MGDNKYKLTIYPAVEVNLSGIKIDFNTKNEMLAVKSTCADLLLYLQDEIKVMKDYSNLFICEVFEDGEWLEIDEEEVK